MPKTILIADDDPTIIKLLQVNLEMEGYAVVCAYDGQDAVEHAQVEHPDLVLLDIMMPRMDGWAAREALSAIPGLKDTPVIVLSARAQQADLRRGYEAGVAAYVTKPFDPTELLDIIERVLDGNYERPPLGGGRL
jgi:two-component system alkaline phosphatase synthesis response regulator PhoP/two-component system response regulator VicR